MTFGEINWRPDDRQLRIFSAIWLIGFGVFGLVVAWRTGAVGSDVPIGWHAPWRTPLVLWAAALVVSAAGFLAPRAVKPVYVAWTAVAFPIGWTISQLLLILTYFGVFTACAVVFRLMKRDALHRRFDREAASYWTRRPTRPGSDRYFHQF
jgi:hypothetical protein